MHHHTKSYGHWPIPRPNPRLPTAIVPLVDELNSVPQFSHAKSHLLFSDFGSQSRRYRQSKTAGMPATDDSGRIDV
jgi:hypothetical protein